MKYLWPITAIALACGLYIQRIDIRYLLDEQTHHAKRISDLRVANHAMHQQIENWGEHMGVLAKRQSDLEAAQVKKGKPHAADVPKGARASGSPLPG